MAVMNFNTSNQTYRQLMGNGLLYSVPRFQRDYSWTETEWDDLWRDLEGILDPTNSESAHYLGYLVLQSRDSKHFDVVDGQQRLTTLSLLVLAVLANLGRLVEQKVEPEQNQLRAQELRNSFIGYLDPVTLIPRSKLTLNRNNNDLYQNYLVPLRPAPVKGLTATDKLLRKAFEWLQAQVAQWSKTQASGAALASLVTTVADRFFFTVITVTDELNAFKVFETLNARGVKLSSTDLLKNYLFSVVFTGDADGHELRDLDRRWEVLVTRLGSESFPDFLRTHWNSRHRAVRHAELFKVIRERVADRGAVFSLVREMEEDADPYAALSNPEDELWQIQPEQRRAIGELRMFSVRQVYPLLLAGYRKLPAAEFTQLLKVLSVISFRYNVIGGLATNEQERVYTLVAERISTDVLTSFNAIVRELATIYPSDAQFKGAFGEKVLKTTQTRNKRVVRYMLCAIEHHLTGIVLDFDSASFNIEHILPENPQSGTWPDFTDAQQDQFVYRLGNMTLLQTGQNRELGNVEFASKLPVYAQSTYHITKRVASENTDWTPERVAVHQRWLAAQATAIWRVAQLA
jgi:hypothetical protein